ncbi:hypothetical protein RHSIM_Rhsim07G0085200 [Rhododendron simsii]|uniref:G-box binding protein multifunctional mosaic region domain-containing protein n=1 Tax=Rhododendron simsii TaxID=118357 RepID=A0A834LJW5_RHOSS|nr:hypothetical protein RHSIM_Rhsim07G0085200 [Rhododendron simsii]
MRVCFRGRKVSDSIQPGSENGLFALAGTIKHSSLSQLEILFNNLICFQSYYVPEVPIPPSYLNSAIMAGHAPHHDAWAQPQPVMTPYEVPYSTIYSPGVYYAHPTVPLRNKELTNFNFLISSNGFNIMFYYYWKSACFKILITVTVMHTAPMSTQLFLSESMYEGITKMSDRLDRVDMQLVDGTHEVDGEGSINEASRSKVKGRALQLGKQNAGMIKSLLEIILRIIRIAFNADIAFYCQPSGIDKLMFPLHCDVEVNTQANSTAEGDANVASIDLTGITVAHEKPVDTSNGKSETGMTRSASFVVAGLPLKACLQAEVDELMKRYETVKVENTALKSEINQLTEEVEKLKDENCALMEKLNGTEVTHPREMVLDETRPDQTHQLNLIVVRMDSC